MWAEGPGVWAFKAVGFRVQGAQREVIAASWFKVWGFPCSVLGI